jgi:hypothetical protein
MKYWEKYTERIEIPEDELSEMSRLLMQSAMKEGELRYREYLIDVLGRVNEMLKKDGEPAPRLTIDAYIAFLEDEPFRADIND